jgi:hypothetical protein
MRAAWLSMTGAALMVLAGTTSSFASEVNCGIVMKSVKMGRSAQDIADTMMISTADIEKCKAADAGAAKAGDAPKAAVDGEPANSKKPAVEGKSPEAGMH